MTLDPVERLNYYQFQYVGAEDLRAQQAYHRDALRRHDLGPHTWGIVSGLRLTDLSSSPPRSLICARSAAMPCSRSGSATMSSTFQRGLRLAYGSWKIIWMRRRSWRLSPPR